ncbi:ABC transporter permease [Desulfonatronospira sp.]|uniref:ABC transporter permease n=1 Tax=Desulfonatronospira sp. TaxID=1962951 RepID=UPI0025BF52DE|nr:ABC transporter permease [Desulfonatronospira sp.]
MKKNKTNRALILPTIGPATFVLLLFFLLPLGSILFFSFMTRGDFGAVIYSFTLDNYIRILQPSYYMPFFRSMGYTIATVLISLIITYPLAYWLAFYGGRMRMVWLFLFIIPFWTSHLVRIYAWMFILRDSGLVNLTLGRLGLIAEPLNMLFTPGAVVLGLVYSYFTFMLLALFSSLDRMDKSVLEAAVDLGASPFQRLVNVTLPMTKGGIIAGSVLVAVPTLGDYIVPDLLGGARVSMIGNVVADAFLRFANWPFGSALGLVLGAIVLIIILAYMKFAGRESLEREII